MPSFRPSSSVHIPRPQGLSIGGFPVPANRFDGRRIGLAIVLEGGAAGDAGLWSAIRRGARAQGSSVIGRIDGDRRTLIGLEMPRDPARLFVYAGVSTNDVRTRGNAVDLRDHGAVLARFVSGVRGMREAGEAAFAPMDLGPNLAGAAVTQRMFGRSFVDRAGAAHASWEPHPRGGTKADHGRAPMFLWADGPEDWRVLARTLVARLDRDGEQGIGGVELGELLRVAPRAPEGRISADALREFIELEVASSIAAGVARGRDVADRLSVGFPAHEARSGRRLHLAQFSTPPAIGQAAAEYLRPNGRVLLEPTAGNGVLMAASAHFGALGVGVEIDPDRARRARASGAFEAVHVADALVDAWPANPADRRSGQFDGALVNPPFRALPGPGETVDLRSIGRTYVANSAETLIAARAIDRVRPGGAAVLIMPAELRDPGRLDGERRRFQGLLALAFERVSSVALDAHLYQGMGARAPVLVHFVEGKRGPDDVPETARVADLLPEKFEVLGSWESFWGTFNDIRARSEIVALDEAAASANAAAFEGWTPAPEPDAAGPGDDRSSGGPIQGPAGPSQEPITRDPVAPEREDASAMPEPTAQYHTLFLDDFRDDPFTVPYQPFSAKAGARAVIERTLEAATAQALRHVLNARSDLDAFVAERLGLTREELLSDGGPLSPEQIDAVALAFHNRDQGRATLVGDLMGVGKGRQMAAHALDAFRQGRAALMLTNKAHLFRDLVVRDLAAVARTPFARLLEDGTVRPFIVNSNLEGRLTAKDGRTVLFATPDADRARFAGSGTVPDGTNLILATYSQFQTVAGLAKLQALRGWVAEEADAGRPPVIMLDEVHEAAGPDSRRGQAIRDLLDVAAARGAEVVHSSATSIKSGRHIGVYKHALPETGLSNEQLTEVIERDPLAMQEVLSTEMARSTMIQRKMSSAGVVRETVLLADLDEARMDEVRAMSEAFAGHLRAFIRMAPQIQSAARAQFLSSEAGQLAVGSGADKLQVEAISPATMFDNISRYYLLAVKGRYLRELIGDGVAQGEKITVLQEVTGDALARWVIADEARQAALSRGEPRAVADAHAARAVSLVEDVRVGAHPHLGHVLVRAADRMLDARGYDALGNRIELRVRGFEGWLDEVRERTEADGYGAWRVNTLDRARDEFARLGLRFEDLTQRQISFEERPSNEGKDAQAVWATPRVGRPKMQLAHEFNAGELDALGFNNAAATGLSVQASPDEGVDVRRRRMIFLSYLKNIAEHRQAEGRVDRTGQVSQPRYVIPNSGLIADDRLASLFNRGNRSLTSSTSGSRESDRELRGVADLLNPIGNRAVAGVLMREPEIAEMLGIDISAKALAAGGGGDLGRKLLGRAFVLGPDRASAVLAEVDLLYHTILERLDREGINPLKLARHDWRAEVEVIETLADGDEDAASLAQRPLQLVELRVQERRVAEPPSQVIEALHAYLHGRSQPFERLDRALDVASARRADGAPRFDHPLYADVVGRRKMGMQGLLVPRPMPPEVADMLRAARLREESALRRELGLEPAAVLTSAERRTVAGRTSEVFDRAYFKRDEHGAPDARAAEVEGGVAAWVTTTQGVRTAPSGNADGGDRGPVFDGFDWKRVVRAMADREEAIDELSEHGALIEPGRLVAVDARALPPRMQGHFGEVYARAGADRGEDAVFVPALITSASYDVEAAFRQSSFRLGLFVPGSWHVEGTTVSALRSNLELARAGVEEASDDGAIPAPSRLTPPPLLRPMAAFAEPLLRQWDERHDRGVGEADTLMGMLFEDRASGVVEVLRSHLAGGESNMVVRPGRVVEPAGAALFRTLSMAVPQGTVTRRKYALTGNLFTAAASVAGIGRASLGEKIVFTDNQGTNHNAFLLRASDQQKVLESVRRRARAQSQVRGDLAGSAERIAAALDLQVAVGEAMRGPLYGRTGIDVDLEMAGRARAAILTLHADADEHDEGTWRRLVGEGRDVEDVLERAVARLPEEDRTYPASLLVGGDLWGQHARASGLGTRKKGAPPANLASVRVDHGGEAGATRVQLIVNHLGVAQTMASLERDQLVVMLDGADAVVAFKKRAAWLEDDRVAAPLLDRASDRFPWGTKPPKLGKGTLAFRTSLRDASERDALAAAIATVSGRRDVDLLLGGHGKSRLAAVAAVLREVEQERRREAIRVALREEPPVGDAPASGAERVGPTTGDGDKAGGPAPALGAAAEHEDVVLSPVSAPGR